MFPVRQYTLSWSRKWIHQAWCLCATSTRPTNRQTMTAAASCGVVGPKDRRRIITIPPTRIATLRCRPYINLIVGDGGERNPASEVPVPSRIFQPTGSPNLTLGLLLVFNCNHTSIMHRFRFDQGLPLAGSDVIVLSPRGGAAGKF